MDRKAQGTIEYLVIIAIVVVIALVVVGLLLQIMSNFGGMSESAARTAWKSSTPFAIVEYSQTSTTMTMVLQNMSGQTLDLGAVTAASGDVNNLAAVRSMAPGATYTLTITGMSQTCTAGSKYAYPKAGVYIDYNTATVGNLKQYATADIVGTCS